MELNFYMDNIADDNVDYFIGSQSGFFFIGNREAYYKDIMNISNGLVDSAQTHLAMVKSKLNAHLAKGEPIGATDDEIKIYHKRTKSYNASIAARNEYLSNFETIPYRKILDIRDREIERDGKTIIVTGAEPAKYWFKSEYETGVIEVGQEVHLSWEDIDNG